MIKNLKSVAIVFMLFVILPNITYAQKLQFSLHKLESGQSGPRILVLGGIQGDEPGGFNAASLLVTDYKITRGSVWVVPNLNFESIIKRSRGIHGDMNRKFSQIKRSDPEYQSIQKIKSLIVNNDIDIILNLHDGSGFYRTKYIDKQHNPNRWGQSIIIDQDTVSAKKFGRLQYIANSVMNSVNTKISNSNHYYAVKNTWTKNGDVEMEKTLTYFAIKNSKPAFGIEASKSFLTHERVLFHLLVVESFMDNVGVRYQKEFKLTLNTIHGLLNNNIKVSLYNNHIQFDASKARTRIGYVPINKNAPLQFKSNNPLVAITSSKTKKYKVNFGNRQLTYLEPEYFDFDHKLVKVDFVIDGNLQNIKIGSRIRVKNHFMVNHIHGYRVNIIGYRNKASRNESGYIVKKSNINKRFSIDKTANVYRVEFYDGKKFSGMVLVDFGKQSYTSLDNTIAPDYM
ncbi:MAG: M99 family carboxypeptidase catalytic domain-containing protein [Gammaproteobacteria bacterium]